MSTPKPRLSIAVLFGGRSTEHEVSIRSATNVMRALGTLPYDAIPIFVTPEGRWLLSRFEDDVLATPSVAPDVCLVPGGRGRVLAIPASGPPYALPTIDILFPVLHGLHGEDGSVQGLAAVAQVPLAGCGILGSAAALDKDIAKRLLVEAGLPTARSVTIRHGAAPTYADLHGALGLPLFIKPARQGSSVGIGKVTTEEGLAAALAEGFRHDGKLIAEEFIEGREIECSVLEDPQGGLFVSRPGEIAAARHHGFYTYDAKYNDPNGAVLQVPADLPREVEDQVRDIAARAFHALGCDGMARVDVFVMADLRILVNEVNTIPGFTDISMYPKAMAASGVGYAELIERLVAHGMARASGTRPT